MGVLTGSITETGATSSTDCGQRFNLSLSGFGSATVDLERSFDGGSTWQALESFTADSEKVGTSHEGASYRLNCTSYTSGTIVYRISG